MLGTFVIRLLIGRLFRSGSGRSATFILGVFLFPFIGGFPLVLIASGSCLSLLSFLLLGVIFLPLFLDHSKRRVCLINGHGANCSFFIFRIEGESGGCREYFAGCL